MSARVRALLLVWLCWPSIGWAISGEPIKLRYETKRFYPDIQCDPVVEEYGVNNRLPSLQISALAQDAQGYMWVGTLEGLARFDGYRLEQHGKKPVTALQAGFGKVWVGTPSGLYVVDTSSRQEQSLSDQEGLDGNIAALARVGKVLWVGTNNGVLQVDPKTLKARPVPGSHNGRDITALTADDEGRGWIGTENGLLYKFEPGKSASEVVKIRAQPPPSEISSLLALAGEELWIGTRSSGVLRRKSGRWTWYTTETAAPLQLTGDTVTSMEADDIGNVWIGTTTNLNYFDRERSEFVHYMFKKGQRRGMPSAWVMTLFQSNNGALWIGSNGGGACLVTASSRGIRIFEEASPTPCALDLGDKIFVGNIGGGFGIITPALDRWESVLPEPSLEWVTDFAEGVGGVWVGSITGLYWFDLTKQELYLLRPGLKVVSMTPVGKDLWVSTWGDGLYRLDLRTGAALGGYSTETSPALSADHVYLVRPSVRDPSELWVGMAKGGLALLKTKEGVAVSYRAGPKDGALSHDDVASIFQGQDETLWVGTWGGGLNRFDPKTERFEKVEALDSLKVIYDLKIDRAGIMWGSSPPGLFRFELESGNLEVYGENDGFLMGTPVQGRLQLDPERSADHGRNARRRRADQTVSDSPKDQVTGAGADEGGGRRKGAEILACWSGAWPPRLSGLPGVLGPQLRLLREASV